MKPVTLTSGRLWLSVLAVGLTLALVSWDFKHASGGYYYQDQHPTDTPKVKKTQPEKKVRDLDDVLDEMNTVDIQKEMQKAQEELAKAMQQFDAAKIKLEVEKAMKEVDMEKMMKQLKESMGKINMDEFKMEFDQLNKEQMKELQKEMAKIKPEIEKEMAKVKLEMEKMGPELEKEMAKVKLEMEKLKPELEKEMAKVKVEMEKAKVEIEKAKAEVQEYKGFVDGLEKDGLINKNETYTITHKDGELIINGKKVSAQVYSKYRDFLQKHKKFSIKKSEDDFDIDMD